VLEAGYDVLVATSMVDLATLRGLVPSLAALPCVVYFHENQFAYPIAKSVSASTQQHSNTLEAQMVSLYSAIAADRVVFNSRYNQDSFIQGCDALLGKLPDKVPRGILSLFKAKMRVIPVPLRESGGGAASISAWRGVTVENTKRVLRLLWVGRFEYDKGADRLLNALNILEQSGVDFELAVVGQQFRNSPVEFSQIKSQFAHRLVQFGYIESRVSYRGLLAGADIIFSTAIHEFQGLAVLEAVAEGCVPVVPGRLAYPELFPSDNCYQSYLDNSPLEAEGAAALIAEIFGGIIRGEMEVPDVSGFSATALKPRYAALIEDLCSSWLDQDQ